ncbi:MAG: DUF3857 and transglutaminase domain-containing protein [Thermoanaerobaculales bacterium]|nr:DUF3857 and transglutaminase domain-containing protein [Thermoanaerobaculales bacterium]
MKRVVGFFGFVMLVSTLGSTASWPEIPDKERILVDVPGFPNAAAVVLFREGKVFLSEDSQSSHLEVYTRIKILTQEGVDYGSISLSSSDYMRVKKLQGRTHLPGGKVVDLSKDATFEKEFSDYYGSSVVSCAMPEVVEGAIIEYSYRTYFDSIFFPRMWFFQAEIPTLFSRVSFEIPHNIAFAPLVYKTLSSVQFEEESKETVKGGRLTYTAMNLPPVPDEPSRFPFRDLACRVMLLPTSMRGSNGMRSPLFETWKDAADVVWGDRAWGYTHFLGDKGAAKKQAKILAGSGSTGDQAKAIYRWVRDEIETEPYGNVWVGEVGAGDVIKDRKGDLTEKALLLHAMLKAVKIDSDLVWVNPKTRSRVEQNIPNPAQFFRVLVVADIDGQKVFLDPTDRTLAFAKIKPSVQGVPCLIVDKKKQEWNMTPASPPEDSIREATLQLAIDEEGRVEGSGRLILKGNHAWSRLGWRNTEEATKEAWTEWVEDSYENFDIDEVGVTEVIEDQVVTVTWEMRQRDDDVLGDEVLLLPADPLAVGSNPFTLPPNQRWTPVQLVFGDVERVVTHLSWPEGWVLDGEPVLGQFANEAGRLSTSIDLNEEERTATLTRELRIAKSEFVGRQAYGQLRALYVAALENDAEELIVVVE